MNETVTKPVDFEKLKLLVEKAIDKSDMNSSYGNLLSGSNR